MEGLKKIVKDKKIVKKKGKRPLNMRYEHAKEFGEYVGLDTIFVLKLFKIYGMEKVLGLKSWLKDCPHDPDRYAGLVRWKLEDEVKQAEKIKNPPILAGWYCQENMCNTVIFNATPEMIQLHNKKHER
jgi:hypothetical protein